MKQASLGLATDVRGAPGHVGIREPPQVVAGVDDAVLAVEVVLLLVGRLVGLEPVGLHEEREGREPQVGECDDLTADVENGPLPLRAGQPAAPQDLNTPGLEVAPGGRGADRPPVEHLAQTAPAVASECPKVGEIPQFKLIDKACSQSGFGSPFDNVEADHGTKVNERLTNSGDKDPIDFCDPEVVDATPLVIERTAWTGAMWNRVLRL